MKFHYYIVFELDTVIDDEFINFKEGIELILKSPIMNLNDIETCKYSIFKELRDIDPLLEDLNYEDVNIVILNYQLFKTNQILDKL